MFFLFHTRSFLHAQQFIYASPTKEQKNSAGEKKV